MNKLPAIVDLYGDIELQEKQNELNILLNQPPHPSWLKNHPTAKFKDPDTGISRPVLYIPVQRLEWLMTKIFIEWYREIKETKLIANSIHTILTVHYKNPITNEWMKTDGQGAQPLQTDSGAGAIEFDKIKSNAVQIGSPAAVSYAFKDAVESFGKLFGKDLNRADKVAYDNLGSTFGDLEKVKKDVSDALEFCQDEAMKINIIDQINTAEQMKTDTLGFYQTILQTLVKNV